MDSTDMRGFGALALLILAALALRLALGIVGDRIPSDDGSPTPYWLFKVGIIAVALWTPAASALCWVERNLG